MKINLLLNSDNIRSGYLNVDPMTEPGHPRKTRGDLTNLDDLVDDAEAEEIIALDVIDYLPAPALESTLAHWFSKIRHGGTITLSGMDIMSIVKGINRQELTLTQANILLYGEQKVPWQYRKSTLTMQTILNLFQSNGFKIIQKRFENYSYIVKAERP